MQSSEFSSLIRKLIAADPGGPTGVAAQLGVSASTVSRWLSGSTQPHPRIEGRVRNFAKTVLGASVREPAPNYDSSPDPDCTERFRFALSNTLAKIRETLYRSGSLSSRQDALDDVSKLLFSHICSLRCGGTGISAALIQQRMPPAKALKNLVSQIYCQHLPISLAHELKPTDFQLRLKDSENDFAKEIISCFDSISSAVFPEEMISAGSADILNEVFGQFLSDSFAQEKELGQYLTPTEIVRFMSHLGINSLSKRERETICHPEKCSDFGVILDPSCGVSSFLTEILRQLHDDVLRQHGQTGVGAWIKAMARSVLVGIDKSEQMIRLSLTNLALLGSPAANLHFANALARTGRSGNLSKRLEGRAGLILTNPPFGAEFPSKSVADYKIASQWSRRTPRTVASELLFLERYIDWLKPGGTLLAIVPDSVLTNRGIFRELRTGLSSLITLRSVVSLPPITFRAAGTSTKTSVLHLIKDTRKTARNKVYFSVCRHVGYDVATRGSQRRKIPHDRNDLVTILPEACRAADIRMGRLVDVSSCASRWDATYHAGLPPEIAERIENPSEADIFVHQVACLSNNRVDPRRSDASAVFRYIEISDVDARTLTVTSKALECGRAPTRARKRVSSGNLLVSTVRPERRTIGVVPSELDNAVCSTGFAVLKCNGIEPTILARLLQSDFASIQILRNNIGIAYPAISEECLLDILLPISRTHIDLLRQEASDLRELKSTLAQKERELSASIEQLISSWRSTPLATRDSRPHQSSRTTTRRQLHMRDFG